MMAVWNGLCNKCGAIIWAQWYMSLNIHYVASWGVKKNNNNKWGWEIDKPQVSEVPNK